MHYLLRTDPEVRIVTLDALTYAGSLENLKDLPDPARHSFVQGDIADRALLDRLFAEYAIDTVVHFAAETHVDRSIHDPGIFVQTNVLGTFALLEAARKAWWLTKLCLWNRRAFTMSPPTKSLARSRARSRLCREHALPTALALCRLQSLQRPFRPRVSHHLRAACQHQQLLQQLRAASVPGKINPTNGF